MRAFSLTFVLFVLVAMCSCNHSSHSSFQNRSIVYDDLSENLKNRTVENANHFYGYYFSAICKHFSTISLDSSNNPLTSDNLDKLQVASGEYLYDKVLVYVADRNLVLNEIRIDAIEVNFATFRKYLDTNDLTVLSRYFDSFEGDQVVYCIRLNAKYNRTVELTRIHEIKKILPRP